jgi:hypothetical protein
MPQAQHKSKVRRFDHAQILALSDSGLSQPAVSRAVGCHPSHVSKLLRKRREAVSNGHPADPPAHSDTSERIIGIWETLDTRVQVLEAFMAAQQSAQRTLSASAHADVSERIDPPEWVNRGTHFAADMIPLIKGYAAQHRLEMREVIDLALRQFFAGEGERHG